MSYTYKILTSVTAKDEVRGILGVTETELSDDDLDLMPLMPAADRYIIKRCPDYVTILTDPDKAIDLKLAAVYVAAANALPTLKLKLLQVESDNKTVAQRFKTAFDVTIPDLMSKAESFLSDLISGGSSLDCLMITVAPDIDVITGE